MIVDARIVGAGVDQLDYIKPEGTKGQPDFVMSRSSLSDFARCPHKWRYGPSEDESTDNLRWGSLIDCVLTGNADEFQARFIVHPETYPSAKEGDKPWHNGAKFCKDWNDAHADMIILKPHQVTDAEAAVAALKADPCVRDLLDHAQMQVEIRATWRTEDGSAPDVPIKGLIDILPARAGRYGSALADLKTAADASLDGWSNVIYSHGYEFQAALYMDLYFYASGGVAKGDRRTNFLHVVSESVAPWEVGKRMMTLDFIQRGRALYHNALERYARCVADDVWPGYDEGGEIIEGFAKVEPKPWMMMSMPAVKSLDAPGEMP